MNQRVFLGLGLTINPKGLSFAKDGRPRQVHFNAGLSQFHCSWLDGDGTRLKKNVFSGSIWLQVKSIEQTVNRLNEEECAQEIKNQADGTVVVKGPYGNTFVLEESSSKLCDALQSLGSHPGGFGSCIVSLCCSLIK